MLNKKLFKIMRPLIEQKLKEYPYCLISTEMSGLGTAIDPSKIIDKSRPLIDGTFSVAAQQMYAETLVNAVEYVNSNLDSKSKRIIENAYFNKLDSRETVINELEITKHKYYALKNAALYKYGVAFGFL